MGLFKNSLPAQINADECEHILGILLTDRKRFINFSGIAEGNIYAGLVIGQAFNANIERLDDEFDALAISYVWKVLSELGANEDQFAQGATAVFDNFEISDELRKLYGTRVKEYSDLDTSEVGVNLLVNIAGIYNGKLEKNDPRVLSEQLDKFHKLLEVNIKRELTA